MASPHPSVGEAGSGKQGHDAHAGGRPLQASKLSENATARAGRIRRGPLGALAWAEGVRHGIMCVTAHRRALLTAHASTHAGVMQDALFKAASHLCPSPANTLCKVERSYQPGPHHGRALRGVELLNLSSTIPAFPLSPRAHIGHAR